MSWLLSSLGDLVAPQTITPLHTFREHWKAIKVYYIDRNDDTESFQESSLPQHFVSIIHILIEEEKQIGPSFEGPCMEFFLKERIFETFCTLGAKDIPAGTRKLMLTVVTDFLNELQQRVLQHNSVHKSIMLLIIACQKCADNEQGVLVDLIAAIIRRLAKSPELCGFFFAQDAHESASSAPVFMPLHVLLPLLMQAKGGVARRASNVLCAALLLHEPGVDGYLSRRANLSERIVTCIKERFATALQAGIALTAPTPTKPKAAPLPEQVQLATPAVDDDVAPTSSFAAKHRATAALHNDASLAKQSARAAAAFRDAYQTSDELLRVNHDVAHACADALHDQFLIGVVGPALMARNDRSAGVATLLASDMMSLSTGRLRGLLSFTLLGNAAEDDADAQDSMLWRTTMRRVSGKDESVARASLRLAGSLLSTKDTVVLRAVLLRRLIPRRYLRERHVEVGSVAPPQHTITTLLRLFPGQQYGSDTPYAEYLIAAREDIQHTRRLAPPPSPRERARRRAIVLAETSVQNQDVYSSTNDNNDDNNDNNIDDDNDVQTTPKEPPATPRSMARLANTNQHSFDAGAMADALLDALASAPRRSLQHNLAVTDVLTTLCYFDDPILHEWLFAPADAVRPGVRTLLSVLTRLSVDIARRFEQEPQLSDGLKLARADIVHNAPATGTLEEIAEAHYLRAVVVLTEFVKELAACVQVKFCEPVAMEEPVDLLPTTTIPDNVDVSTPINDQ